MAQLRIFGLLLWCAVFTASVQANARAESAREIRLSNGLTVILKEQHRSKTVAAYLMVRAGICCEGDKTGTGISHFTEHLIVGSYMEAVKKRGGQANAFTSYDQVGYYFKVSSDDLDEILKLFAGDIAQREFSDTLFHNERNAVMEEVKMRDGRPMTRLWERLMDRAYQVHPYGRSIGGEVSLVKRVTKDEVVAYLKQRYVPSHMLLVVVGDFDTKELLPKLEAWFGTLPEGPYVPIAVPPEPEQLVERVIEEDTNDTEAYFGLAYRAVSFNHPDAPALDLLASILSEGKAARFSRRFIATGITREIEVESWIPRDPGLFIISGSVRPNTLDSILEGIEQELETIKEDGVTSEELERIKTQYRMDVIQQREDVRKEAFALGDYWASFGTVRGYDTQLARYEAIRSEDIQRVARTYLVEAKRTKVVFRPATRPEGAAKKISAPQQSFIFQREKLKHGAMLLVREESTLPYGVLQVLVDLGPARHTLPPALRILTARMFERGTAKRSAEDIFGLIENWGGSLSASSNPDYLSFQLVIPVEKLEEGLALFKEILTESDLSNSENLKLEKKLLIQSIRSGQDDAWQQVREVFREKLFPNHPYGARLRENDVENVDNDSVRGVVNKHFCPERAAVVSGGGFPLDLIRQWAEDLFALNTCVPMSIASAPSPVRPNVPETVTLKIAKPTHSIVVAFRGPEPFKSAVDPDRAALNALARLAHLRIYEAAREQAGISYSQGAFLGVHKEGSLIVGHVTVREKENLTRAEGILRKEFERLANEPLTDSELSQIVQAIISTRDVGMETTGSLVVSIADAEMMHGKGDQAREVFVEMLRNLTPGDIARFARQYLTKDKALTVIQYGASK